VNLVYHSQHGELRRREEKKAEVTINRRLRSTYCTIEANC